MCVIDDTMLRIILITIIALIGTVLDCLQSRCAEDCLEHTCVATEQYKSESCATRQFSLMEGRDRLSGNQVSLFVCLLTMYQCLRLIHLETFFLKVIGWRGF